VLTGLDGAQPHNLLWEPEVAVEDEVVRNGYEGFVGPANGRVAIGSGSRTWGQERPTT
jgi:hypothetical protein